MVCDKKNIYSQLCKRKCDYKKVMRKAKPDDVKAVVELSADILRKKIPLNKAQVKLVMANRHALRHLVHPGYSINSKRRYLAQRGGGLGSILARAARFVGRALKPAVANPAWVQWQSLEWLRRLQQQGQPRQLGQPQQQDGQHRQVDWF